MVGPHNYFILFFKMYILDLHHIFPEFVAYLTIFILLIFHNKMFRAATKSVQDHKTRDHIYIFLLALPHSN